MEGKFREFIEFMSDLKNDNKTTPQKQQQPQLLCAGIILNTFNIRNSFCFYDNPKAGIIPREAE